MAGQDREVKVLDGGLATELQMCQNVEGDPLWSARLLATNPQAIVDAHVRYLHSGADVITTASYQASFQGFQEHLGCTASAAAELISSSVRLAKQAVDTAKTGHQLTLVAGSVGPYGASLHDASEYNGNYVDATTIEELMSYHRPKIQCLVNAGCDILAMETIPAAAEGTALVRLLREFPGTKAWLSFSCCGPDKTAHREDLATTIQTMKLLAPKDQLIAIGVNCCPPDNVSPLLRSAAGAAGDTLLIAYPNSGETWTAQSSWTGESSTRPLHSFVKEWLELGAKWVGGCCRTGPEDIARVAAVVQESM